MKRIFTFFIILVIIVLCPLSVKAYNPEDYKDFLQTGDTSKVGAWFQGRCPDDGGRKLHAGTGSTVGGSACSYFSVSYMLVKSGYMDPTVETPLDLIDKTDDIQGWETGWGLLDFSKVPEMYPDFELVDWRVGIEGYSFEEQKAIIKGKMDEGLFVILCVVGGPTSGHYVFVDGFDSSDDMILGDSGFASIRWSEIYGASGTYISHMTTFRVDGVNVLDCPSIYDSVELSSRRSNTEVGIYNEIVSEWELRGMPKATLHSEGNNGVPEVTVLSDSEKISSEAIKENILAKQYIWVTVWLQVASLIGLIIIIYGVLMVVCYMFDKVNNFFELSLFSILTLGKCRVWDKNMDRGTGKDSKGIMYCDNVGLLKRFIIIEIVGFFITSGLWIFRVVK